MKEVVLIFRKPFEGQISIEYLFYNISAWLKSKNIPVVNRQLKNYSKGLLNRVGNLFSITPSINKIVHVTGDVHYAILGAWFSKRVLTIHDLGFMLNKGRAASFIYWLIWIYLPVKFSHKVTVVSENTKHDLLKYVTIDESKIAVIGNFIDDVFQPRIQPESKSSAIRLLQIGTTFNKNIERLIDAVDGLDCILTIIGPLPENLISLLGDKRISYINKYRLTISEVYDEYKNSDLLCYVSTSEGFGMPILEAQATGIPVICSDCSSMPEVAGNGAYFVNPFDVSAIRAGIEKVIDDKNLAAKLIAEGYVNAKRFSQSAVAQQYYNIYQDL